MKKRRFWLFYLTLFLMVTFLSGISWAQLILGQYEDEAPFRTWNTFGISTASSLAMGETQFTLASDCAASLSNPALLTGLPKITFTINSSFDTASFFKYSVVNTGVFYTEKNIYLSLISFDFAGLSVRVKNWTFALSMALVESYYRPSAEDEYSYMNRLYYTFNLSQEGHLKNINFSVARKFFNFLSAGIGFNYVYGYLEKDIRESRVVSDITITDNKSHELQGLYINGGLVLDLTRKIEVAVIFRTPYVKKSESESLYRFSAPPGDTDIKIEASGRSEYKQPFVAGIGVSYEFSPKLRVASDFTFYNWSKYSIIYFEEEDVLERNFKDIIKIGSGFEYLSAIKIFGQNVTVPLRAGLSYDPQPMRVPDSYYFYLSFGTGLHWRNFFLDGGMLVGKEWGSGDSLTAHKVALSLSFKL